MTVLQAILLGLVQGITEFLPVSSSGHLSIFQNLFGMTTAEDNNMMFDVLLHLGTLVSVVLVYRKDIREILYDCRAYYRALRNPKQAEGDRRYPGVKLLLMMIVATLPLVIILPVKDYIERLYYSTAFIGIALILTGAMLFVADRMDRGRKTARSMGLWDALMVGVCQAIATVPGLSRSGTTITAGISTGLERQFAVKFSFLISIPAVLGANLLSLIKAIGEGVDWASLPAWLVGTVVAGGVGYVAIWFMRSIARKGKFGWFAYYCAAAGVVTLIITIVQAA